MFLDEARLAARIRHPNVVPTLDVVATEGELFLVMEYVPGESLARLLRAASRTGASELPLPVAASIMVDVLHGLHAAHEASDEQGQPLSLVHRDVSPQNVLVGTDGAGARPRLRRRQGDRAACRRRARGSSRASSPTWRPSSSRDGKVDRRADVFAAAVVFWEMLTGERLFDGADEGEILRQGACGETCGGRARSSPGRRPEDGRHRLRGLRATPSAATSRRASWRSPSRRSLPLAHAVAGGPVGGAAHRRLRSPSGGGRLPRSSGGSTRGPRRDGDPPVAARRIPR